MTAATFTPPPAVQPVAAQRTAVLFKGAPLLLDCGKIASHIRVAYHTYGEPGEHATLVLHALTGNSAVHEWWPGLFGNGQALDPARGYVVCSNVLGGCAGSSGPAELGFEGAGGAALTLRDMVRVQRELLRHLGVKQVTLIGGSMGGMQAYAWLSTFPDLVKKAVIIAAPARHSPWAVGLNTAARSAIASAPGGPGLQVARQLAMLSYRTPQSLARTQSGPSLKSPGKSAIESYLEYQGQKLAQRFCERSYLTLLHAMDHFALSDADLAAVQVPCLVVGISSDQLYPAWEVQQHALKLGNATYWELESEHGHDAFLMDGPELGKRVAAFLRA